MPHWVPCKNGNFPQDALKGGKDHSSDLILARARHGGDLIPGKLVPAYRTCYVAHDGKEHEKQEYEVLCGLMTDWVRVSAGQKIPYNALPGGHTKEGETLYIGRVNHESTMQLGKVHTSHGSCYISYGGKEIPFKNFEVLILK